MIQNRVEREESIQTLVKKSNFNNSISIFNVDLFGHAAVFCFTDLRLRMTSDDASIAFVLLYCQCDQILRWRLFCCTVSVTRFLVVISALFCKGAKTSI